MLSRRTDIPPSPRSEPRRVREGARGVASGLAPEHGSATVAALWIVVIGALFAAVAAAASGVALRGSLEDASAKQAVAAADAGTQRAVFRHNKLDVTQLLPCLDEIAGNLVPVLALGDGWCEPQTATVGEGTFTYRTKYELLPSPDNLARLTVVSTGQRGDVTRRVRVVAEAPTGVSLFGGQAVRSIDELTVSGNGRIAGSAASNADVTLEGDAEVCGDATPGPGSQVGLSGNAKVCPGYSTAPAPAPFPAAPADQGDAATSNDNGRFFGQDVRTGLPSWVTWDPSTRTLDLTSSGTLTLGGDTYSICRLRMSGNAVLIVAAGASVRLFFDSPESCGLAGGAEQLSITGNAQISNTNPDPTSLQTYLLGSDSLDSKVKLAGNALVTQNMLVHAPRSEISISGNGTYNGAVMGKKVDMSGNAVVSYDQDVDDLDVDVIPLFRGISFVHCQTDPPGSAPDSGC